MVTLSTLKYKIDVEGLGLDPALLRAQIKAERWNGGLNLTRGRGLGGGLPDAAFDAAGNLKLKKPDGTLTDYPLTPAQFGGEQMTLTVLYKGLPVTVEKPFTPVETAPGVIDLLVLAAQGKAQTVTPEELRSVQAITAEAKVLVPEMRQALADTEQFQADWATAPRTLLHGTVAQRRALVVDPPRRVMFLEDDTRRQLNYFPGVGWRDVYGNDPDAAPPPPDTGVY